jgi:hypothetical protein
MAELILFVLLVVVLVNTVVAKRETRRALSVLDRRVQGLHSMVSALLREAEVGSDSVELSPDLQTRAEMLVAGGNEDEAVFEIAEAFCSKPDDSMRDLVARETRRD